MHRSGIVSLQESHYSNIPRLKGLGLVHRSGIVSLQESHYSGIPRFKGLGLVHRSGIVLRQESHYSGIRPRLGFIILLSRGEGAWRSLPREASISIVAADDAQTGLRHLILP